MTPCKIPWGRRAACALVSSAVLSAALMMISHAARAVSPAAPSQVGQAAAWLQGWPMAGHDPQRTNRSPNVGPVRPHLRATYRDDCSAPLVGPDGSIYGWCARGLTALTAMGHRRWAAPLSMIEGSPPMLAPGGSVLATANSGRTSYRHLFVVALTPQGAVRWRQPNMAMSFDGTMLVGRTGTVYVADGAAVVAITPDGRPRWRRDVGSTISALAARADGVVLTVGAASISAVDPAGHPLWRRMLGNIRSSPYISPSVAVDARGYAYVGTADGMVREFAPDGAVVWAQRTGKATSGSTAPSLALGPGGTLVVAGIDGRLRIYR